jgi:hypothetical protein
LALSKNKGCYKAEAGLIHDVCDIRARQREILQCAYDAPIKRGINAGERRSVVEGELWLRVCGSIVRLAIRHPDTLQNAIGILSLVEEEVMGILGDLDAEEEVKITHVLNGELATKLFDDVVK